MSADPTLKVATALWLTAGVVFLAASGWSPDELAPLFTGELPWSVSSGATLPFPAPIPVTPPAFSPPPAVAIVPLGSPSPAEPPPVEPPAPAPPEATPPPAPAPPPDVAPTPSEPPALPPTVALPPILAPSPSEDPPLLAVAASADAEVGGDEEPAPELLRVSLDAQASVAAPPVAAESGARAEVRLASPSAPAPTLGVDTTLAAGATLASGGSLL